MNLKLCLIVLVSLSLPFGGHAQYSNVFLDRTFWKSNPSVETIDKYIAEGNDITALNNNAFDAVCWALIEKTNNETVKYLLSFEGNDVNKVTHDGRTYIFWAAYKSNLELMKYLIDKGASTDIIDDHGNTVLNFAASTGQTSIDLYEFLLKIGSDLTKEKNHDGANALLLVAPYLTDFNLVNYLESMGTNINSTDSNGLGFFDYAAKGGNIQFLKRLNSKGLLTQDSKKHGWPVIMASIGTRGHRNSLEVYQFLENLGVSLTGRDSDQRTALHNIASRDKDLELITYFLEKQADVNQEDKDGNTPFLNAARNNTLDIVKTMHHYVKDINVSNNQGQTALARAVERNDISVVTFLIEEGSTINFTDVKGNTLAYYLLKSYRENERELFEKKLKLLVKKGLNLKEMQSNGNSLLHLAVETNNLALVKRVAEFGIDINLKNKDGLTALHLAAMKAKDPDILNYLLSVGASKDIKTDFEESVYDLASENELLQKHNIDISFLK